MTIPIRVVITDDHPIVRMGLRNSLAYCDDIEVIGEAADGDEAAQQVWAVQPDVLLLDISMAGLDMTGVIQGVLALPQPVRVLVCTANNDCEHINAALEAGARGYVLTTEPAEVIAAAIRAVATGQYWLSNKVAQTLAQQVVEQAQHPAPIKLTEPEVVVLRLVAEGQTNREIGAALHISQKAVEKRLSSLYHKLDVTSRSRAVAVALRLGLL